ncbi:maleylacetoacetate isomerase [Brevundimonas vesicularis]|uniref:maleylacetoacetate isomerase n=1 Tax=Brevundimonas vesicularis TaxID=41276 RepID=UPI0038D43472
MKLHGYFRSSAAWRVRIALGLKGLEAEQAFLHLRKGEQRSEAYLALNPQGLLPAFETDEGEILTQSLAIIEYLDEVYPEVSLLPGSALQRARIRAAALLVATDIHPIQNLKILNRVKALSHDDAVVTEWARQTIDEGLDALNSLLQGQPGPFAFGETPTLADICLIPQLGNARRFGVDLRWPRLLEIEAACKAVPAFAAAQPENQPDAE